MVRYGTNMVAQKTIYFAGLDGLRAFSILFVIYHHAAKLPWMGHLHGYLGVDIFFVLSGFLITYLLAQEKEDKGNIDINAFYVRRAFRILPVYAVMLVVYIVATSYSGDVGSWTLMKRDLPYFLTFLNEFAPSPNGFIPFGFSWTLGVEEKFYLFWPFFCFFLIMKSRWPRKRSMILALIYAGLLSIAPLKFQAARSYSGLFLGSCLALGLSCSWAPAIRERLQRVTAAVPLAFFGVGMYLVDLNANFVFVFSWSVVLLTAHVVTTQSWLRRFLSHPFLTWVGKRSYGMYLIHMLPLERMERWIHLPMPVKTIAVTTCTFIVTALLADVLFRLVESPARNYGKRLLARREEPTISGTNEKPIAAETAVAVMSGSAELERSLG
jgi:peptidoglycan/LPS O-acetylase OafA/YrhL